MTCEEFLALGEEVRPRAVYWIEGYSQSGEKVESVRIDAFARPITTVVEECKKTPKENPMAERSRDISSLADCWELGAAVALSS